MKRMQSSGAAIGCAALILAICACNVPGKLEETATASPTVTQTAGAGTTYPSSTPGASATPAQPGTPTPTVFVLPPTPGRTPTSANIPPRLTATPAADAAHIDSFSASPADVDPGGQVTLSWKAKGDAVTLFALDAKGTLNQGTAVQAEGSATVSVDPSLRNFAQFMLSATGGGQTVTSLVKVAIHCPDTWFFGNPPATCPSGPATSSDGASEHFERGWMLWVGATETIYVLYDDGSPRWSSFVNQWQPGQPEDDPGIVPPAGMVQPVRGFGMLWRTEAAGQPNSPRVRLGWATETESSFGITAQCDSGPGVSNCYLKDPLGETIWLKPDGSGWQIWTGP